MSTFDSTKVLDVTSAEGAATIRTGGDSLAGRYQLGHLLGSGGFGAVWEAFDLRLRRRVAIKELPRADGGAGRALREARAAARLSHANVTQIYELLEAPGRIYLVCEFVPGRDFGELIASGGLADGDVAAIGSGVCDALAHAHARGVVHRDVKPSNVVLVEDGRPDTPVAKLTDFGVARFAAAQDTTDARGVVGTLAYMSPERARGDVSGPPSDVYSLGITLYEAWAGKNPVRGKGPTDTARNIRRGAKSLAEVRTDLPPGLTAAIDSAISVDVSTRPTASELGRSLRTAVSEMEGSEDGVLTKMSSRESGLALLLPQPPPWAARVGAGLVNAVAGWLLLSTVEPGLIVGPALPAGALGLLAVVLPRVAWLVLIGAVVAGSIAAGLPGVAMVVAPAALLPALLMPRSRFGWYAPALGPALGLVGLAPVLLLLLVGVRSAWRRAAVALSGAVWIGVVEVVSDRGLLAGPPRGSASFEAWSDSVSDTLRLAVAPLFNGQVLLMATVWALFAAVLPILVRGRRLWADVVGTIAWSVGLVVSQRELQAWLLGGGAARASAVWTGIIGLAMLFGLYFWRGRLGRVRAGPLPEGASPTRMID